MTATLHQPTPVIGWNASRSDWLVARQAGLGASDVTAVLGFSRWRTPWQVWAEKLDVHRPDDTPSAAADLGNDLEPWLLEQAGRILGRPAVQTEHRLYAHPQHPWRLASPDGTSGPDLVECKTAGLASGFGIPDGWTEDSIPLGYELQVRWQMHVLDRPAVHVVALVAGLGLRTYRIERDAALENDLVGQVADWWQRHIVERVEPPLGGHDADTVRAMYPQPTAGQVDLDHTDATELMFRRSEAKQRAATVKAELDEIDTRLKALLGEHAAGRIGGRVAVTWNTRAGSVDWQRLARDLAEANGLNLPETDQYRRPATRVLDVKDIY